MNIECKYCCLKLYVDKLKILILVVLNIVFFNTLTSAQFSNLKNVTPKIISPDTVIFNSAFPTFKWERVNAANGYTVYLYHNNNVIYESSSYRIITATEYKVFQNLIKEGEKYSIRIRAYNQNSWSNYSKEIFFSYVKKRNVEKLNYPAVLSKRETIKDTVNGETLEYLLWNKVRTAKKYRIVIEGIEESPIFGNVSHKLIKKDIVDTLFTIDQDILDSYEKFRWRLKSISGIHESKYSPYFYFEKNKMSVTKENNPEDIIIRVKYAGFLDEMMLAKYYKGNIYLPVLHFLSQLKLNHKVDYENQQVSGMFMDGSSEHFNLDLKNAIISVENNISEPINEHYILSDLEYFLRTSTIEKVTRLSAKTDMSNLTINFSSDFTLPFIEQKINEKKLAFTKMSKQKSNYPLLFKRNRNIIKGGFFDYSLSSTWSANSSSNHYIDLNVGAELLGGDIQIGSSQSFSDNSLSYNKIDYKWRYAFLNNKYISNFSIGNNVVYSLQSYNFKGIQISNKPIEQRKEFGVYRIEEEAKPDWKIEVYKNTKLIDIIYTDENGKYNVNIPFSYGTTILELHEIGPNGEYNIKNRLYQIPNELLPKREFEYNLNAGKLDNSNDGIFQADASYGINDWLTTKIGADVFSNNFNQSSFYSTTSARVYEGYIANFTYAPNAYKQFVINSLFNRYASLNLSASLYDQNSLFNPTKIKSKLEGNLFLPFTINDNSLSVLLKADKIEYGIYNKTNYSFRTIYNYKSFSPSIEFNQYKLDNKFTSFESTLLKLRLNYSLNINSSIFTGNIMDAGFVYDMMHKKMNTFNINFSTTVLRQFRVQLSHTTNFQNSISNTQLRFIFDLPFFRTNTTISKHMVSQSIVGSVNYNSHEKDFNFYNRGMIGRSAAAFKFFEDRNMNNVYDRGEKTIDNIDVRINSIGNKRTLDNGNVLVNDLESYAKYNVELIDGKNKNPMWFPYIDKFSFVSDPNQTKEIQIPFYEVAEIFGSVKKKNNGKLIPIPGLTIVLENKSNKKVKKIKTLSDGSFYYYGLQPGKYNISIDSEQLSILKLKSYPAKIEKIIRSISLEQDFGEFNFVLE